MKTTKLVLGIICIVLAVVVMFQSCAAAVGDAIMDEGGTSGATGTVVAILMLAGGIVSIAARNSKGGAIAGTVLFGVSGIMGLSASGIFADLKIWGAFCLVMCVIFVVSIFTQFKKVEPKTNEEVEV